MMKKTLSLMIILSASLSTSLHAHNAMRDITDYRKGLEQAAVLNDQENVNIFAEALVGALTQAKVTSELKNGQTYDGVQLPQDRQVKNATYKWGKKATKQQAEELYRAIDALAVVGFWEEEDGRGKERLAQLLSRTFGSSKSTGSKHILLASARYQTTLQAIRAGESSSVLYALTQAAAIKLPYDQSTYVGQVHINDVNYLAPFKYNDFYPAGKPENGWIEGFYVKSEEDQKALKNTKIPTFVKGRLSGEGEGAFGWSGSSSFGAPDQMGDFGGLPPHYPDFFSHPDMFSGGMEDWRGSSLFSSDVPGVGMVDLWRAPFSMERPSIVEGKEEQGLELDKPPAYSGPHRSEIDVKAAEAEDESEPGAPPPAYKVSKRAEVATQLESLGNKEFTSIIANLKAKGNSKLSAAIKGLTSIASKPANRDEFYHAFRALEALSVVDKGLFKNAAGSKTWAELGSGLIKDYAIKVFKEKVPKTSSAYNRYDNILYSYTLDRLVGALLEYATSWTDVTDLQGVKATLKEISETDIGNQALVSALKSRPLKEVFAAIKHRIKDIELTTEFKTVFKTKVPRVENSFTSQYYGIRGADTLENLAKTLLDGVNNWDGEQDLQGVETTLVAISQKGGIAKEALDKVLAARNTTYETTLKTIREKVVYDQARNTLKKALIAQNKQREADKINTYSPLSNVLQILLAQTIYEDNSECLAIVKKLIKTEKGNLALLELQSQDDESIPETIKGLKVGDTIMNIEGYTIPSEE